jgi:hypothetical protein
VVEEVLGTGSFLSWDGTTENVDVNRGGQPMDLIGNTALLAPDLRRDSRFGGRMLNSTQDGRIA